MASDLFGDDIDDLKPVVANGSSDSAALDAVFELMVHGGRDLPMAKTLLIPEAIDVGSEHPRAQVICVLQLSNGAMGRTGSNRRVCR